jgi:hypothetical protein
MSRTGSRCRCASGPARDEEIVRNAPAPFGFGRRRAIGGVAAARRSQPHRLRRVAYPLTLRRSERRYRYSRSGAQRRVTPRGTRPPGSMYRLALLNQNETLSSPTNRRGGATYSCASPISLSAT